MNLLEGIFRVIDFILDICYAVLYGFNSLLWRWLGCACIILAGVCFAFAWYIPGVICGVGAIACFIKEWNWFSWELKNRRKKKSEENLGKEP